MPIILDQLSARHADAYPTSGTTYHIALFNDSRASYSFSSANVSGSTLTITGNTFIEGTKVVLGGTIPTPLSTGTIGAQNSNGIVTITGTAYYVKNKSGDTLQLSATNGGSAITLTSTGSGTMTISDVPLDATISSIAEWVRKEVSSYEAASTRQSYAATAPTIDTANSRTKLTEQSVEFNNTSGSSSIIFDKALMIRNGSSARGSTSGTADSFYYFGSSQTIAPGENRAVKIPNILANA